MTTRRDPQSLPEGRPAPLGATPTPSGVNFSVHAPAATAVELLLYADAASPEPQTVVPLDPRHHRTDAYWHVLVPDAGHGQVYAWRADGPCDPARGLRFDREKVLLDPWARAVVGHGAWDRERARRPGANGPHSLRAVVVDPDRYDWEGDRPLPRLDGREVIYELHVGGFTRHLSSGVAEARRGTYAGLAERLDHLRALGVTTVELMPVHAFDHRDAPAGLVNVWGYSPVAWFAPHPGYSSDRSPTGPVDEFRDMVKALHRAGLRVIIDVVFNHTAEGDADGPVIGWRGLADATWYLGAGTGHYLDVTGCGNTVNANDPVAARTIVDCLRWWVEHLHVDGFRFDLASSLCRGTDGEPLDAPPVVAAIDTDPVLAGRRLVAEAWDAAGLHQVGSFPGRRFAAWNGLFRDTVRRFLRGDTGTIEELMARLVGSRDVFDRPDQRPSHGVNLVTAHDGFTLADLVAYERKQNERNGEQNRDGSDHNLSWNCGVEGPSDDPAVTALRRRQVRNFLVLLLAANGTPMLWMGDEVGHTRRGNNNPWCQDNELNWLDWDAHRTQADLLRFVRLLVRATADFPLLRADRWWSVSSPGAPGDVTWHGTEPGLPDWRPASRNLACCLDPGEGAGRWHLMLNAADAGTAFTPPPARAGQAL
ncbi:MAG: glycogen debranching protein GlgX, partial [Krumholzibacteria bacterium]|nr:glycogen debranching protein GlgX [Candidatus Krumholzibacteria bacterium]